MTNLPRLKTKVFQPGLESEHEVGLSGVGVSVVTVTLAMNTTRTAAQLIASPPNTAGLGVAGPVVHSLGAPPTMVFPLAVGPVSYSLTATIGYQYCTADNSAVYLFAKSATGAPGGVYTRVTAVR